MHSKQWIKWMQKSCMNPNNLISRSKWKSWQLRALIKSIKSQEMENETSVQSVHLEVYWLWKMAKSKVWRRPKQIFHSKNNLLLLKIMFMVHRERNLTNIWQKIMKKLIHRRKFRRNNNRWWSKNRTHSRWTVFTSWYGICLFISRRLDCFQFAKCALI